jgi:hypothetical protein
MPAAIVGLLVAVLIPTVLTVVFVWRLRKSGVRYMFTAEHGFWYYGALFGHMKHRSGAVLWFLVRFLRQGLAIVIVNVGEASNQVRAVMFLMVLFMYFALLTAVAPYDKFFRNHDGSAGAAKETGPRYKHLELSLILGQALTVSLQFRLGYRQQDRSSSEIVEGRRCASTADCSCWCSQCYDVVVPDIPLRQR